MAEDSKYAKKLDPFKYPSKIHKRTQNPRQYKRYQSYLPALLKEFGRKCVYCRRPILPDDKGTLQIDHYRPESKFTKLSTSYSNLYLSCSCCNNFKGDYWSDVPSERIVNPCDHVMSHHLRYNEAVVESNSPNGKITIDGLKINSPESVLIRERYNLTVLAMIGLALKLSRKKTKDPIAKIKIEEQLEKCLDWLGQATLVDIKTCKRMLKIK